MSGPASGRVDQVGQVDDPTQARAAVAYFSMEVAVDSAIPSYAGGLGVLAGDHLRAAADAGLPMVGVTLLYKDGYFEQRIDAEGHQHEEPVAWTPRPMIEPLDARVTVTVCGRPVTIRAWRHVLTGATGGRVWVIFLDTDLAENVEEDRAITDQLYGGDQHHRLRQEVVLGMGGVAMLQQLGFGDVPTFHMNEGHSSLLVLALLEATGKRRRSSADVAEAVRRRCVFTTHTPVPEGHDRFDADLVRHVLGDTRAKALGSWVGGELNMTELGMAFSRFVNAVSLRHARVSQAMFPEVPISSITNGVHAGTWVGPSMALLFDRYLPDWRTDNDSLRYASAIAVPEVESAHQAAKRAMVRLVADRTGVALSPDVLTLGVARRAARYKRTDLLLGEVERLRDFVETVGPLQVVYSGKAHPHDADGKAVIARIHDLARVLDDAVKVVYLAEYSLELAKVLCAGVDVWVNTPSKPHEASGTSGMKAAMNGVPSLSVLDGWWLEGHVEGVTGWSVGDESDRSDEATEVADLHAKLASMIGPLYYRSPERFGHVRRASIALNGSFFTTERMLRQYAVHAYRVGGRTSRTHK